MGNQIRSWEIASDCGASDQTAGNRIGSWAIRSHRGKSVQTVEIRSDRGRSDQTVGNQIRSWNRSDRGKSDPIVGSQIRSWEIRSDPMRPRKWGHESCAQVFGHACILFNERPPSGITAGPPHLPFKIAKTSKNHSWALRNRGPGPLKSSPEPTKTSFLQDIQFKMVQEGAHHNFWRPK